MAVLKYSSFFLQLIFNSYIFWSKCKYVVKIINETENLENAAQKYSKYSSILWEY